MTETEHQKAVIKWCEDCVKFDIHPELELIFHVPNERKCSIQRGRMFKAMGVRSGVPDLVLPVPNKYFHGLYIEMKSETGTMSENQKWWRDKLTKQGYAYILAKGSQAAIKGIEDYILIGNL